MKFVAFFFVSVARKPQYNFTENPQINNVLKRSPSRFILELTLDLPILALVRIMQGWGLSSHRYLFILNAFNLNHKGGTYL